MAKPTFSTILHCGSRRSRLGLIPYQPSLPFLLKRPCGQQTHDKKSSRRSSGRKNKMNKIKEELLRAEEFIKLHPILKLSPGDLRRAQSNPSSTQPNPAISSKEDTQKTWEEKKRKYLKQWPEEEQQLWLDYFEEEM